MKQQIQLSEKAKKQSRYSKGCIIAATRRIVKVKDEDAWFVESEKTDNKFYKVTVDGQCECYDGQYNVCKHVYSVIISRTT
ncbi:hypothetical protein BH18THE2_BH18THE2_41390 [soil metagenome]